MLDVDDDDLEEECDGDEMKQVKNQIMNKTVRAPDVKRRTSRSRRESDCFFMIMS